MREDKILLLELFTEVIRDLNLNIDSISIYERSMYSSDLIIQIKWWDNGSLGFKRYFSPLEIEGIKKYRKDVIEYIKGSIKGSKEDIHE